MRSVVTATRRPVRIPERTLARGLILGLQAPAKSTTLLTLLGEQIRRGRPVVAIDLKGSPAFAGELRAAAQAAGRPFMQWTPDGPSHWNPLAAGRDRAQGQAAQHRALHRTPLPSSDERYLQMAIQVAQETAPDRPLTLSRVVELLSPGHLASAGRSAPRARSSMCVSTSAR